jgi:hypothetical protein
MPKAPRETVPSAARVVYDAVLALLDAFAVAHLTEEYRPVLHTATLSLARRSLKGSFRSYRRTVRSNPTTRHRSFGGAAASRNAP